MSTGRRQLFAYWRVDAADVVAALRAARAMQHSLCALVPALRCGLYRRGDDGAADATLMETYALAGAAGTDGIDAALQRRIDAAAAAALARWQRGPRHVEVFDACDG